MPFPPDGPRLPATTTLPLRGVTVLAVEDSRFSSDALRLILTRAGARLRRVETLAGARLHLDCYRPDLVIADLGLPDGRGEEVIADASARGIPVLAVSGDPDGRGSALDAGAVAFFEKPIPTVAGFLRLVQQLLTGTGAEAEPVVVEEAPVDPMALHDDLRRAADLLRRAGGGSDYVAGFLRGLARCCGDPALEDAARQTATPADREALAALVEQRLRDLVPMA